MWSLLLSWRITGGIGVRKLDNLYALYELGRGMGSLRAMLKAKKEMDSEIGILAFQCMQGLEYLLSDAAVPLHRSKESATKLHGSIRALINGDPVIKCKQQYGETLSPYFTGPIKEDVDTFQIALSEELKLLPLFSVEGKGNLSIDRLVDGASAGYPATTLALLDDFTKREIDEAGKCLAFAVSTACGFHILRAVEIGLKGYVVAATGTLPKLNKRNWGGVHHGADGCWRIAWFDRPTEDSQDQAESAHAPSGHSGDGRRDRNFLHLPECYRNANFGRAC